MSSRRKEGDVELELTIEYRHHLREREERNQSLRSVAQDKTTYLIRKARVSPWTCSEVENVWIEAI